MTNSDPVTPQPVAVPGAASGLDGSEAALRLIAANARLNAIVLVSALVLVVLGGWVYSGVKYSLREIRAGGLQTILDTELKALQLWVDHSKAEAQRWAEDPRVRRNVVALAARPRANGTRRSCNVPESRDFIAALQPYLREEGSAAFNAIDPDGTIIASAIEGYCGLRVQPATFLADLTPVFLGQARFLRPYPERARLGDAGAATLQRPIAWIEAPVRDDAGTVVAALGFGKFADEQFARILAVARPGQTGEVYAFDDAGIMISESRFLDELKAARVVPADLTSSMFRVHVRDPGGDLASGHVPEFEVEARALTRLAALAIASRNKADATARRGIVLEPYRNYRGVEVVGAWQWLPEYDMAVAIEVSTVEAYAPLTYLNWAFGVILVLLATAIGAVLWSSLYVRRLRRQVGDARLIGQYRLEKQIGEGGMARVYLARHALLKRPTAIKMLKTHLATDEMVARFEREAQLASRLVHPNTIEIYDYGRTPEGEFYYVMEYLNGLTLDRVVADDGPLPVGRAIHVLKQVCAALREAHANGLVHRDIKPHNIMLCQRGGEYDTVKLLDFGIVKNIDHTDTRDITQYQTRLGTPLYMSPERIRNAADADVRADIYSVGAVAFYLLTGRDLFETTSEHDLTYHVLHTPPRAPSGCVPGLPPRLDALIVRCLAKDRTQRPHDVIVVLALLEALAVEWPWLQRDAAVWWRRRAPVAQTKGE